MREDIYRKIIELITVLEEEQSKYGNSFEDISTKIMLKSILDRLHELRQIAKK
ncbi:hypothetical protein [Aliarcobacter cryaerophilus]|uniref:hypothetical protein n=1 Tax=Aliarcobacter cryaerophilus TaxID=28198 RepID=UPI001651D6C4|nr:hypothetical protein [Aliarcobacter cryaerophilus]